MLECAPYAADLERIKEEISDDFDEEVELELDDAQLEDVAGIDRVRHDDYIRHPVPDAMYVPTKF